MELNTTRIITDDVAALVAFYESITGIAATWRKEGVFAEFYTGATTLAIQSTAMVALMGEGVAEPRSNRSITLDFLVEDVDALYPTLQEKVADFVNEPTTMPWGNRSLLFRDPDGNLINFFTPASDAARERFGK